MTTFRSGTAPSGPWPEELAAEEARAALDAHRAQIGEATRQGTDAVVRGAVLHAAAAAKASRLGASPPFPGKEGRYRGIVLYDGFQRTGTNTIAVQLSKETTVEVSAPAKEGMEEHAVFLEQAQQGWTARLRYTPKAVAGNGR